MENRKNIIAIPTLVSKANNNKNWKKVTDDEFKEDVIKITSNSKSVTTKAKGKISVVDTTHKAKEVEERRTNNPYGRPKGSRNKSTANVALKLVEYLEEDALSRDSIFKNIDDIKNPERKARVKIELYKLVTPKPRTQEEITNERKIEEDLHNMYFGKIDKTLTDEEDE